MTSDKKTKRAKKEKLNLKVSQEDLLLFTRQLYMLLNAGIQLVKAIETLANQAESDSLRNILKKVELKVKGGFTFSRALSEFPVAFNKIYIGVIGTGEAFGDMPLALSNLEHFLEREVKIKKRIIQAATYPIFALSVCILFALFTFKFVLPSFVSFFENMNVVLPLPTKIMVIITRIIDNPVLFVIVIIIFIGFIKLYTEFTKTHSGRILLDRVKIQIPTLGIIAKKIALTRLANSLTALLEGGISIDRALELSGRASGNYIFEICMREAGASLKEGSSLSDYFQEKRGLFGTLLASMIKVGEEAGDLPVVFNKISQMYEQDVENSLSQLTIMIEPALILFTGSIIGFIIISIFIPLYSLLQKLG